MQAPQPPQRNDLESVNSQDEAQDPEELVELQHPTPPQVASPLPVVVSQLDNTSTQTLADSALKSGPVPVLIFPNMEGPQTGPHKTGFTWSL